MKSNKANKSNKSNEKKIFNKKLALKLRENGCEIVRTEPNKLKPQFDVYIFSDTPKLHEVLDEVFG